MTPRQRVLTSLNHEEPDRVPIDLGSAGITGIHVSVYKGLRKVLGLPEKAIRLTDLSLRAEVEKEILQEFHVDVINVTRSLEPCAQDLTFWKPFIWSKLIKVDKWITQPVRRDLVVEIPAYLSISETGGKYYISTDNTIIAEIPKEGELTYKYLDYSDKNPPLGNARSVEDIKNFNWDYFKIKDETVEILRRKAEYLYKNTEYALVLHPPWVVNGGIRGLHQGGGQYLRGFSQWFIDLKFRKPLAEAILDHVMEVLMYNTKKLVDSLGEYIHVMLVASDDLGTEQGPQFSIQVFREFYKERYAEIINYVKKHSKIYTLLHSDGSIFPFIKEFIDIGLDIINPPQISAKGMEPERLKRTYGEQITFWGAGADTQHILPFVKPEEVVEHVRNLIKILAPGGGFVFAGVHTIMPPTPPENVVAMFKTAYEYGKYPIR